MRARKASMAAAERRSGLRRSGDSDALFRAISEGRTEGIIVHDASGTVIAANSAAERITARTRQQLLGSSLARLWKAVQEDGSSWPVDRLPSIVTVRTRKAVSNAVMGIERPDGRRIWISLSTQPVFLQRPRRELAVVVSFIDITEIGRASCRERV